MNVAALATLYVVVGIGCAVTRLAWRTAPGGKWADALLLVGAWPLYGPFLVVALQGQDHEAGDGQIAFLVALRRARQTSLGAVLPDEHTARALAGRLRTATSKVDEIDGLLVRPEFSEAAARKRIDELRARDSSECALSTASIRLQNIRRLRAMRDRCARELDEVQELLTQLSTQVEVVRLAGAPDESMQDLIQELLSKVEGLDEMLDEEVVDPPVDPLAPDR